MRAGPYPIHAAVSLEGLRQRRRLAADARTARHRSLFGGRHLSGIGRAAYSVHLPLSARIEQCVTIEVPAGRIRCRQARSRPRLPQLNTMVDKVIGGFLPSAVAHFEAVEPHRLVRLRFPVGPMPWDTRAVLELST